MPWAIPVAREYAIRPLVLRLTLVVGIFLLDLILPGIYVVYPAYVAVVASGVRLPAGADAMKVAALCVVLTILGASTRTEAAEVRPLLVNRAETVALVVVTAALVERWRLAADANAQRLCTSERALAHLGRVVTMSELSATIAHELTQPLAAVMANGGACLQWLSATPPDVGAARDGVAAMVDDAERAGAIVGRVRAALRNAPVHDQPLDINVVIVDTVALAQRHAQSAQARIRTELADGLPPVVGDRIQLQQVLLNLVLNAVDATTATAPTRRDVLVRSAEAPPDAVRVSVHDSGPGIAPELRERIFEPFFTTKAGGLGLGLAVSASLVARMGGRLHVHATDDGGHLELRLPAHAA